MTTGVSGDLQRLIRTTATSAGARRHSMGIMKLMDQLGRGFEPQVSLYLLVFLLFVLQTTGKGLSVY